VGGDIYLARYLNVFLRQIVIATLFLNGLLIGIVTKIHDLEDEAKHLIFFREQINGIREYEIFYSRLKLLLGSAFLPPRMYTHGFITNLPRSSKSTRPISRRLPTTGEADNWAENELTEERQESVY
jgi:hypothetical protein